jgi:hypothetical protein
MVLYTNTYEHVMWLYYKDVIFELYVLCLFSYHNVFAQYVKHFVYLHLDIEFLTWIVYSFVGVLLNLFCESADLFFMRCR